MDLVASIYRRLAAHGYGGTEVHALYRDEVQDFTQVRQVRVGSHPLLRAIT